MIKFALERACAGLFADPGLGKTATLLYVFNELQKAQTVQTLLVIAPLIIAQTVWPAEIQKWKQFEHLKHVVLHGKEKDDLIYSDADVFILNPDGLEWLAKRMQQDPSLRRKFSMLVIDESTKFKHTQTKRFKLLRSILTYFKRRYIATGTPTANSLEGIFGQAYILDEGLALGRYITQFRREYFYPGGYMDYSWFPQKDADKRIFQKLKGLVLRVDANDYQTLPPMIKRQLMVDLPPAAYSTYIQLENKFITELESGKQVVAKSGGSAYNKLWQLVGGALYTTDDEDRYAGVRRWERIHDAKIDMLEALLNELSGKPTLVTFQFNHEAERLLERFGDVPLLDGDTKVTTVKAIERDWNLGKLPYVFGQVNKVSHGLNIQYGGRAVALYSITPDYEAYDQLLKRIRRTGQKFKTFAYHLIARGTIDEVNMKTLSMRKRDQQTFLDLFRSMRMTDNTRRRSS